MVPDLDQSTLEMDVKVLNGRLKNYDPMLALSDYMGDRNLPKHSVRHLTEQLGYQERKDYHSCHDHRIYLGSYGIIGHS